MSCRYCTGPLTDVLDLGFCPPTNSYWDDSAQQDREETFPLRIGLCPSCGLCQTMDDLPRDLFFNESYAYLSGSSSTWKAHAEDYAKTLEARIGGTGRKVLEIACNDGTYIKPLLDRGWQAEGVEPTEIPANLAIGMGVTVYKDFFGHDFAQTYLQTNTPPKVVCGNNVYAHVPDIRDFSLGLKTLLEAGTDYVTLEFPSLVSLLGQCQFDTIYHEHYSYIGAHFIRTMAQQLDLAIWDLEQLPTHGGSYRVWLRKGPYSSTLPETFLAELDAEAQLIGPDGLESFRRTALTYKARAQAHFAQATLQGKTIALYGAAAKGSTFLNYAGIRSDQVGFCVDAAPPKQGKKLPGSHIPIHAPDHLRHAKVDEIIILPWNIHAEIESFIRKEFGFDGPVLTLRDLPS